MTILTAVLILKRRLLKIAKPPVLRTCGNDSSNLDMGIVTFPSNFIFVWFANQLTAVYL